MTETYYDRLGVSPETDQSEIEQAWRELVKETHPDQNDDSNARQQFLQIKEAYDVLSDPEKRERYDRLGHDQYVGDRMHGGEERTRTQYRRSHRRRRQSHDESSEQTGQTSTEDESGVGWRANTRGHDAADYVWANDRGPTAEQAPPTHTADASLGRRVVGYGVVTVLPLYVSTFVLSAWTTRGGTFALGVTVAGVVLTWAAIASVEWLLDTDRRVWTPF